MIQIEDLEPLYEYNLPLEPNEELKNELFEVFKENFIDNPFMVDNHKVKIIHATSKLPGFTKSVKDIQPGYYKLTFTRKDTNRVVKTLDFEVVFASEIFKDIESGKK